MSKLHTEPFVVTESQRLTLGFEKQEQHSFLIATVEMSHRVMKRFDQTFRD